MFDLVQFFEGEWAASQSDARVRFAGTRDSIRLFVDGDLVVECPSGKYAQLRVGSALLGILQDGMHKLQHDQEKLHLLYAKMDEIDKMYVGAKH